MNSIFKCMLTAGLIVSSSLVAAEYAYHEGKVQICRTFLSGKVEIIFNPGFTISDSGCTATERRVVLDSSVSTSVKKSVLATCLLAQANDYKLQVDYITCEGEDDNNLWAKTTAKTSFRMVVN
jgi:hypothetical protein